MKSRIAPVFAWALGHKSLVAFIIAYNLVMSPYSLLRYYTFRTYLDLGIFDQALSSGLRGQPFYETPDLAVISSGNFLGTHFAPLMFLLLPVYAIHPGPETLLTLQTFMIALGALPIYLISAEILKSHWVSLGLAGAYLVNPAVHSLNLFDFHLEAFLPFFIGMAYYYVLNGHWKSYAAFLVLSFVTIEFAAVLIVAMAISMLFTNGLGKRDLVTRLRMTLARKSPPSISLVTIPVALVYFFFSLLGSAYFSGTGGSPQTILGGFLPGLSQWVNEGFQRKTLFWIILLGNLMFLPLRVPTKALMAAPWLLVTIVGVNAPYYAIGYQYGGAFVVPYLIIASAHALPTKRLRVSPRRLLTAILLISIALTPLSPWTQGYLSGIAYEDGPPVPTAHDATLHQVISSVPPDASILTQNNLFTHFSRRPNAYLYIPNGTPPPRFILGDTTSTWYTVHVFGREALSEIVPKAISDKTYLVVADTDGVILLERNTVQPASSSAF